MYNRLKTLVVSRLVVILAVVPFVTLAPQVYAADAEMDECPEGYVLSEVGDSTIDYSESEFLDGYEQLSARGGESTSNNRGRPPRNQHSEKLRECVKKADPLAPILTTGLTEVPQKVVDSICKTCSKYNGKNGQPADFMKLAGCMTDEAGDYADDGNPQGPCRRGSAAFKKAWEQCGLPKHYTACYEGATYLPEFGGGHAWIRLCVPGKPDSDWLVDAVNNVFCAAD